ncbi:MAG: CCA tRNA nucleotidyltransferase, partial [Halobacteriales archaeon]|nr:CCA tRNA nucleotidyltransferase [Halobacteriales archaeon]
ALDDRDLSGEVLHLGSTARDTWLSGSRDIDVFVRFPTTLSRMELEEAGLAVGHAVLPDGREEYAEHPYVHGTVDGFTVDLVPCYAVDDASAIQSAVDRTPFHAAYLADRLTPSLAEEARLAKQFLTGIGAYGSDLRTRGFSGYLTELLVIEHGGFKPLLDAAADWHPPVVLDPEEHGTDPDQFDDPLVVIDPTDPNRNVAAVCSAENVARFQHYARTLIREPRTEVFFADRKTALRPAEVSEHIDRRDTTPIALVFDAPDLVEDELYPQLERSLSGIRDALDRHGFDVLRAETFARDRAVLWFELAVDRRPAVTRHPGPPVDAREHAERFLEKYADAGDDPLLYGPFIDGDRYIVERERPAEERTASALLRSDAVLDMALGAAVRRILENDYDVFVGEAVTDLAVEFGEELADYFDPSP